MLAGGGSIGAFEKGVIDSKLVEDHDTFFWPVITALLAPVLRLHCAIEMHRFRYHTALRPRRIQPVLAAAGWKIANWHQVGMIAAS